MQTKILVNGYQGKMGQIAIIAINTTKDLIYVGGNDSKGNLKNKILETKPDIVLDLTRADTVFENAKTIIQTKITPVIGTSGLTKTQIKYLCELCNKQKTGGIIVPNFSIGAVVMMQLAAKTAAYFTEVEIIEKHHNNKYDAPSSTAIKTAEIISKKNNITQENTQQTPARGQLTQGIPIHSIRLPGHLAHQEIIFGGNSESLTIKHDSLDRKCFIPGIILACQKAKTLTKLTYGLEHLLNP